MALEAVTSRLEFARTIASEAGKLTLEHFNKPDLAIELKTDATPVTIADRQAEQLLRKRIAAQFPDDAILGEEFGEQSGTSGFRWILDPIDGTKSFIHGVPLYGTLIGIEQDGECQAGVIHIPALGEMLHAAVGQGAWHQRGGAKPIRAQVSQRTSLAESLFCTSEVATFYQMGSEETYLRLQSASQLARTWGDCFGYMLVATGRAELMVDPQMSVWDAAALKPIVEEAGGTFTDWQGKPTIYSGEGLATNGRILEEVLAVTRKR